MSSESTALEIATTLKGKLEELENKRVRNLERRIDECRALVGQLIEKINVDNSTVDESATLPDDIDDLIRDPEKFRRLYKRLSTPYKNELIYRLDQARIRAGILVHATPGQQLEGDLSNILHTYANAYEQGRERRKLDAKPPDIELAVRIVKWLRPPLP